MSLPILNIGPFLVLMFLYAISFSKYLTLYSIKHKLHEDNYPKNNFLFLLLFPKYEFIVTFNLFLKQPDSMHNKWRIITLVILCLLVLDSILI